MLRQAISLPMPNRFSSAMSASARVNNRYSLEARAMVSFFYSKMLENEGLEYYIKFPTPNFANNQKGNGEFVFVTNEEKIPVILLLGWAGAKDKYLAKYSQIYEERGLITIRYTAPIKCIFLNRYQMVKIGEKLVKLLYDLNFDNHPIIVHCFSNGGAYLYQNFSKAIDRTNTPVQMKGLIFDSAPGKRRVMSLFRAISAIMEGNVLYNLSVSILMTMFLSIIWLYEDVDRHFFQQYQVMSNTIHPKTSIQTNPWDMLKMEKNRCPQLFVYSKNDDLIPYTDIDYFAEHRRKLGVDVTQVCYEKSRHVKHLMDNRESYITTVCNFVSKCLSRKNS